MESNDSVVDTQETSTGDGGETNSNGTSQDLSTVLAKLEEFGADIASLKRTAKKVSKSETSSSKQTDNPELSQKVEALSLQVAGITKDTEVQLARRLQEETNMPIDRLLNSNYFKVELENLRTEEANASATTGVKGESGGGNVKQSAQYWIAKGEYPSAEQVPDRAVRKEIRAALVAKEKGGKGGNFYNS